MRWAWFRRRTDHIINLTFSVEYQPLVDEITRLSNEVVARSGRRRIPVAIKSMIADLRILAAHKKRRSVAECEGLYRDRVQFGFLTLSDEATAVGAHARYCRDVGEWELAKNYLESVLKKIRSSQRKARPSIPPEVEAALQAMLRSV